jgi:hypothetical protein|tara:strand:+ start:41 stop:238 length:198 start_codon:yes stop_codon:yes gene_type:complete
MDKRVNELEEVLFDSVINELRLNPTAGWAQVARGLLADYRDKEDGLPLDSITRVRETLKEVAPFK